MEGLTVGRLEDPKVDQMVGRLEDPMVDQTVGRMVDQRVLPEGLVLLEEEGG